MTSLVERISRSGTGNKERTIGMAGRNTIDELKFYHKKSMVTWYARDNAEKARATESFEMGEFGRQPFNDL